MRTTPLCFGVFLLLALSACSKSNSDPCKLLSVTEAQRFDPSIVKGVWMPEEKGETREAWKNQLCFFADYQDTQRLLMFVYSNKASEPRDLVDAAMQRGTSEVKIVDVQGVGDAAAAGFRDGALKAFAAGTKAGRVAFLLHSSDAVSEGDARLETIKALASAALTRKK